MINKLFNRKENITIENVKETISIMEHDFEYLSKCLDEEIDKYIKNTAVIASDAEVNHLTFYTYIHASLSQMFAILKALYQVFNIGRDVYLKADKNYGTNCQEMLFAKLYLEYAASKFKAYDEICCSYNKTYNEAEDFLKNSCKCGQITMYDKLPQEITDIIKNKEN